jgi:hypothetical protein
VRFGNPVSFFRLKDEAEVEHDDGEEAQRANSSRSAPQVNRPSALRVYTAGRRSPRAHSRARPRHARSGRAMATFRETAIGRP